MRTVADLKNEFLIRHQASTTIAFYTDPILSTWADAAHKWCAGYHKWPFTEGRVSTTYASLVTNEDGWLVGEYPEGWKSDSIRLLTIGGKRVDKKEFGTFQRFLEDNDAATDRIFTDNGRRYFINPRIDVNGTVTAWGQFTPASIADASDNSQVTVFIDDEDGNEAVLEMMFAFSKKREKKLADSLKHVEEAKRILDELWVKITDEQYEYQSADTEGMFKRIDVLSGSQHEDLYKRDQFI